MQKPKMIFFDYGHTLVYEDKFDLPSGGEALYEHIKTSQKPDRDTFVQHTVDLYMGLSRARREVYLELPCDSFTRYLREYYDIEFDVDETELQTAYWDAISPPHAMPGIDELLQKLHSLGIRTAVISNLWYNTDVLKGRIERLIPHTYFEFYISTHAYGFRKPHKEIFDLALKKANLTNTDCLYVGDEPMADIDGAGQAGITPVWFEAEMNCPYKFKAENVPQVPHIHIHRLSELSERIENG